LRPRGQDDELEGGQEIGDIVAGPGEPAALGQAERTRPRLERGPEGTVADEETAHTREARRDRRERVEQDAVTLLLGHPRGDAEQPIVTVEPELVPHERRRPG